MPLYEADGKKQKPIARKGTNFYSHAVCPASEIVLKRPSHVNINTAGVYAFLYETTSSGGGNVTGQIANFVTGSEVVANHGNIKLEINPVAWRKTDSSEAEDAVGQVTFVYKRVM